MKSALVLKVEAREVTIGADEFVRWARCAGRRDEWARAHFLFGLFSGGLWAWVGLALVAWRENARSFPFGALRLLRVRMTAAD